MDEICIVGNFYYLKHGYCKVFSKDLKTIIDTFISKTLYDSCKLLQKSYNSPDLILLIGSIPKYNLIYYEGKLGYIKNNVKLVTIENES